MATTTETTDKPATTADLRAALGVDAMPVAELEALLGPGGPLAISRAWAAGDIEFGHRRYCITGPVGKPRSAVVLEDGEEWSGPKTKMHKSYRDLRADGLPKAERYRKYELTKPERFGDEPQLKPVDISEAEAAAALVLKVRLTDKGLGEA